tara:strand:- start:552 stop:770 length:219 start_codon:yes stop_codon:yes gene_type:complete
MTRIERLRLYLSETVKAADARGVGRLIIIGELVDLTAVTAVRSGLTAEQMAALMRRTMIAAALIEAQPTGDE